MSRLCKKTGTEVKVMMRGDQSSIGGGAFPRCQDPQEVTTLRSSPSLFQLLRANNPQLPIQGPSFLSFHVSVLIFSFWTLLLFYGHYGRIFS